MGQEKHSETLDPKRDSPDKYTEQLRAIESKVDSLVPHILQLENAAILIIGLIVLLQVLGSLWLAHPKAEIARLYWFVPYAMLLLVGRVIKIRNPYNRVAEVVETGFNYASAGALVGGSITGLLSGGLGAPAGGAIGGGVGFVAGIFAGIIKAAGNPKKQSAERVPCQFCGHQTRTTDKYCENCGREQALRPTSCPKCSANVSAHARFCPNCGEALPDKKTAPLSGGGSPNMGESQEMSQVPATKGVPASHQKLGVKPESSSIALGPFSHLVLWHRSSVTYSSGGSLAVLVG